VKIQKSNFQKIQNHFGIRNYYSNFIKSHITILQVYFSDVHVANSHGDRAEEGRTNDRRHSTNSLWERDDSCMSVGASIAMLL